MASQRINPARGLDCSRVLQGAVNTLLATGARNLAFLPMVTGKSCEECPVCATSGLFEARLPLCAKLRRSQDLEETEYVCS
jgi:hypothetical protein